VRRLARRAAVSLLPAVLLAAWANAAEAQGLTREPESAYRSFPSVLRFRSFLPPEVDLSASFPTPGAQGPQASCTGWAVGYALRSYYERQRRGWDLADRHHLFSPAFLYNQLAGGDASCRRGASISDALTLLQRRGAVSLADFPYDPARCEATPSPELMAEAQHFRVETWRRVDATQLDDVKGELHTGNPVVFGMDVSASFEGLKADEVYDDTSAPRTFAHAMVLVGYSEERQAFRLVNSWGTNWADRGFGWISYRAFSALADRAFVVRGAGMPRPEETASRVKPEPVAVPPAPPASPSPAASTIVEALLAAKPGVSRAEPPSGLRDLLANFQCAKLSLVGGRRVEGFVSSDPDRRRLHQELAGRAEDGGVAVYPWPECEALITFDHELHEAHGLAVSVVAPEPVLREGSHLVVEVTTPDFPSYLYVTYLQASGDAVHLHQPDALGRALPPHTKLRLGGDEPGQAELRVTPPFGAEMVVAMATASPLFGEDRPSPELERDYLTAYRAALLMRSAAGNARRLATAAVATLTTAPR
jgi:hypothetical protein